VIRQQRDAFHKYKQDLDTSDRVAEYPGIIVLSSHTTYENDTTCARGVIFNVSLTCEPIESTTLTLKVDTQSYYGSSRQEGLLATYFTEHDNVYTVLSTSSIHTVKWSSSNYTAEAVIIVCSHFDYIDDGDTVFYINASLSSSDTLYNSSEGASADLEFICIDKDTSGAYAAHVLYCVYDEHSMGQAL
jgi:hypothetical protein